MNFFDPKLSVTILIISLVIVFGILGWGVLSSNNLNIQKFNISDNIQEKKDSAFDFGSTLNSISDVLKSQSLMKNYENTVSMLFLGISGEEYISGDLADTIILVNINTETKKAHLFSIPRDFWVRYEGEIFYKINEFYRLGGGKERPDSTKTKLIEEKIEEITGRKIDHVAVINLQGIKEIVDLAGPIETEEGSLDGDGVLFYIRDRSRPGSDFDRMKRQQKFLVDILNQSEKILESQESDTFLKQINNLQKYFDTNLSIVQIFQLGKIMDEIKNEAGEDILNNMGLYSITPEFGLLYSDYTDVNGQEIYTLHPNPGIEDYSEIHSFIEEALASTNNIQNLQE